MKLDLSTYRKINRLVDLFVIRTRHFKAARDLWNRLRPGMVCINSDGRCIGGYRFLADNWADVTCPICILVREGKRSDVKGIYCE